VRIDLDASVYGGPFDDQSQERVRQEAEAFVDVLDAVVAGRLICLNSDILLRLEVRRNPSTAARERIEDFLTLCPEAMAESAEVLYLTQALQQLTLRVPWRFKLLHPPLSLSCRLVQVLRSSVQVPVLAMAHTREALSLRRIVAYELVRDEYPRHVRQPLRQVQDVAILVDGPLEIVPHTTNRQKHGVQVPFVAGSATPAPELMGISFPELQAPLPDGLIGHGHPTGEQKLFHLALAEAKANVEPDARADDFRWQSVLPVGGDCGLHDRSMSH
jgi:hypothetical protein